MKRGHSYYNLYFHLTWHTKANYPYLTIDVWKVLARHIKEVSSKHAAKILALNGTEDHVHVLIECHKWPKIPDLMWEIKGKSSYDIARSGVGNLFWQAGYSFFTVSEEKIEFLIRYIEKQKEHHRTAGHGL